MSEANGHKRVSISAKGRVYFEPPRGGKAVLLDVAECYADYCEMDASFRDETGKIPSGPQTAAATAGLWDFAKGKLQVSDLSLTEAMEFIRLLKDEYESLKGFFAPASSEGPSSRESTRLTFSE